LKRIRALLELHGSPSEILAYERTILNILPEENFLIWWRQGHAVIEKINKLNGEHPPLIAATRKTQWSHWIKKAVALGGGATLKLNLGDGVLVKDNHCCCKDPVLKRFPAGELVTEAFEILTKADDTLVGSEVEQQENIDTLICNNSQLKKVQTCWRHCV